MKIKTQYIFKIAAFAVLIMLSGCYSDSGVPVSDTGVGGSLARFSVVGDFLYVVDNTNLKMYNVSVPENPNFIKSVNVGRGIETIYPFAGKLFIGSQNGLYIYDIKTDGTPEFISEYRHFTSCDPVATDGQFAYVTLRSSNDCNFGAGFDQLEILDVSDVQNPQQISVWEMQGPLGVGVDGETVFVCEDDYGLKIFDVTDKMNIQMIEHFTDIKARDVIVLNGTLLVITSDTIFQLDYSDLSNITIISSIPIEA